jgi:hypothetical protein
MPVVRHPDTWPARRWSGWTERGWAGAVPFGTPGPDGGPPLIRGVLGAPADRYGLDRDRGPLHLGAQPVSGGSPRP